MFAAPRFIAIDDNPTHLAAIQTALQQAGTSSYGIQYRPEDELPDVFSGVRCLFVDLHLVSSLKTTDEKNNYGAIAQIIDSRVASDGGPFLLVVWTEFPQHCVDLERFLNEHLTGAKPIALLPLSKTSYINVETGEARKPGELRAKIDELLLSVPQLAALLVWETDVLIAAGATLASVLALVPEAARNSKDYRSNLDSVLSKLACAAVGKHNVERDPRSALVQTLVPILSDRVSNRWSKDGLELWKQAITKHGDKSENVTAEEAGEVNRMMHLAPVGKEQFGPADWGSVVDLPFALSEEEVMSVLGVSLLALYKEFKIADDNRVKCTPVLIRIGAVCDAAQQHPGPIPYVFGFEIPRDIKPRDKLTPAIWKSPSFSSPQGPFILYIHNRFGVTAQIKDCSKWNPKYRIREQLLMHLISANAEYISRPGVIEMG